MEAHRKTRSSSRDKLLSVGEVASRLRVTVDVVRSLTDSGQIKAARTGGGHRRYTPEQVARFQAKSRAPIRNRSTTPSTHPPRLTDPDRDYVELEEDTLGELEAEARRAEVRERAEGEQQRLEVFKKLGRDYAKWTILPTEWHAKVNEDLEDFVTTRRFPPSLSALDGQLIVQARVNSIVSQYRDAENARQQKEREAAEERRRTEEHRRKQESDAEEERRRQAAAESRIKALIEHGNSRAWNQTAGWTFSDAERARRDVTRELKGRVQPDWTDGDVDDVVDEVLDDWEEEDDEEEADGSW